MKVTSRRTGLTPHVIRVWERRYGAVSPSRTPTNRRVYSNADIERLSMLRRATEAGNSIGRIAHLSNEQLGELVRSEFGAVQPKIPRPRAAQGALMVQDLLQEAVRAVEGLDAEGLEDLLSRAAVSLSRPVLMDEVVVPLLHRIGDMWHDGTLRVAHEHLASALVRTFVGGLVRETRSGATGPVLIVATPAGQHHEFGALIAASAASADGWSVRYLGPNLPAEEIAGAALQIAAAAIALSIAYPGDDPHLGEELRRIRRYLGPGTALLVGGRCAEGYRDVIESIGAMLLGDIAGMRLVLESLRSTGGPGSSVQ